MQKRTALATTALSTIVSIAAATQSLSAQACVPPPTGIVGWWPGDGEATDVYGHGGALQNGATYATGYVATGNGEGFSLDGVDDFLAVPASTDLGMTSGYTFEGWVKSTGPNNTHRVIAIRGAGSSNDIEFYIQANSNDLLVVHNRGNGGSHHYVGFADPPANAFFHLAVTFDGNAIRAYYDGVEVSRTKESAPVYSPLYTNVGWEIGRTTHSGFAAGNHFQGTLDELSLYDRPLSQAEIQAIVTASTAGKCKDTGPPTCIPAPADIVGWWPGDGDAGDLFGHGGSLQNGAMFGTGHVTTGNGQGFSLDGFDDFIGVPASTDLGMTSGYTFEGWMKSTGPNNTHRVIAIRGAGSSNDIEFYIQANSNDLLVVHNRGNGGSHHYVGFADPPANAFFHLAVTFDGNAIRAYYDGVEVSRTKESAPVYSPLYTNVGWEIGRTTHSGFAAGNHFQGILDELSLYDRALSHAEIQAIVTASTAGKCKDADPPAVVITGPADQLVTSANSVVLQASVTDASPTAVTSTPAGIDTALPAGGGDVSGTVALDLEGANTLAVSATDTSSNTGGTSITVIRDSIAPDVTVDSPAANTTVGSSPVALTISVADATATTVTFGGNSLPVPAGGGQVAGDVALTEGANDIVITTTDAAGNQTARTHRIILDLSAPVVTIDSPADGACFGPGESPIPVTATVDDLTATTVGSTPAGVAGSLPAGGGMISGTTGLVEGSNLITVTATDSVNNLSSASITVILDTTAPSVELLSPSEGTPVRGDIDLEASATDTLPGSGIARVDFEVDGNLIASVTTAPFATVYDTSALSDGLHTFAAIAFDGKGNSTTSSAAVEVDNTAPSISFTDPVNAAFASGTMNFTVSASDLGTGLSSVTVLAGGAAPTDDPSTTFDPVLGSTQLSGSEDTTAHPDGPMTLTATAVDEAGNESTTTIEVTIDNTAPDKAIQNPCPGQKVKGTIPITVSTNEPNLAEIELFVDGVSVGSSTISPFTIDFDTTSRLDGRMSITAVVKDLAANSTRCRIKVRVDNISVRCKPRVLNLRTPRHRRWHHHNRPFFARMEGVNVGLMMPTDSHQLVLRVPGGNPVQAVTGWSGDDTTSDCDSDGVPELTVRFPRHELVKSIRAGIAAGKIKRGRVRLTLVADGSPIGSCRVRLICGGGN